MANNRLHIVCLICEKNGVRKDSVLIAKYYPNTGWYRKLDGMDELLDNFFEAHKHPNEITDLMWGTHIGVMREVDPDDPH